MIRWILPNLGTAAFDAAADEPGVDILDVRDLLDKPGNPSARVAEKVAEGSRLLKENKKVVVCCDYGMSRSNAIAAGILASVESLAFGDALRRVMEATGERAMRVEVIDVVRRIVQGPAKEAERDRILVLGGSGFLGRALVSALEASGAEYAAPSSDRVDAGDAAAMALEVWEQGVSTLVFLAAPRVENTSESLGRSLAMLRNALAVCSQTGVRLVFPSSWEIYAGHTGDILADETLPPRPRDIRGETKFLCETLIGHYREARGLSACVLRLGPVYGTGAGRPPFIHNFLSRARRNLPVVTHQYANGLPAVDLLHETDAARALLLAATAPYEGTLNIGAGLPVTTARIAKMLVEKTGSKSEIVHIRLDARTTNVTMDTALARRVLGWQPEVSLEKGLEELVAAGNVEAHEH
ncbi:MAG: NAD-dependent epimerase/dehydratase family protein [Deltaproteobacteria bacterium]|nr:NAD-dependent epimerase/dehydratase family protein [Deltaproteobacteria bacterium]